MRKLGVSLLLLLVSVVRAFAQDPVYASVPAIAQSEKAQEQVKVIDKKFLMLGLTMHATAVVDGVYTYRVFDECPRCVEDNPFARPILKLGKPKAYLATLGIHTGVMYVSGKMRKSKDRIMRKIWWLPPVAFTIAHALKIHQNINVLRDNRRK